MTAPTKTPRVDALIAACASGQELPICALSDFEDADNKLDWGDVNQVGNIIGLARTLETELAAARAEADELARRVGVAASQDLLRMIGADPFVPDSEINEVIARVRAEMEKEKGNG